MGKNVNGESVLKSWTHKLSWKEQTVLLSTLRVCDWKVKNDISKRIVRRIRNNVLNNGGTESGDFMKVEISDNDLYEFSKDIDSYPVHFLLHLIHASEIIWYCCEDIDERKWFNNFYLTMVDAFHMKPESEEQMHCRLQDGVDTVCHKT